MKGVAGKSTEDNDPKLESMNVGAGRREVNDDDDDKADEESSSFKGAPVIAAAADVTPSRL